MDPGSGKGFGAVLRRDNPSWPFSQKIASLEYCASFQKEAKVCIGYKKRTNIREYNSEVIENEKFSQNSKNHEWTWFN